MTMYRLRRAGRAACVLILAAVGLPARLALAADAEFLAPEVAFRLSASAPERDRVALRYDIAPGYRLYRDKFAVVVTPAAVQAGALERPRGSVKFDAALGKEVEVFRDQVTLALPLRAEPGRAFKLAVTDQGCADEGLCYPPAERVFRGEVDSRGGITLTALDEAQAQAWQPEDATLSAVVTSNAKSSPSAVTAEADSPGHFASALQSRSLWRIAGVFALAGLLLSFTPCVLPMVPILSSIIVGQGHPVSRLRGFTLALAYSLGMALVYTGMGVAAGLLGEGLAGALQNAWVLGGFALLLIALALSMFGLYELQLPGALQSRLTEASGRLQGGRHAGVFMMGGLSALIVGPCVAAPLAGALVYISQSREAAIGGVALFALALGMSGPLLLVGVSAGSLLPRTGSWMERIKHAFGALLLGVALWMVSPVLPMPALMLAMAAGMVALAAYLGAFERLPHPASGARRFAHGAGLLVAVLAVCELVGLAAGGRDPLQPLKPLAWASAQAATSTGARRVDGRDPRPDPAAPASELRFERVATITAIERAVREAQQPVMVDVYADWCVACKEIESLTFGDATVRARLAGLTLLRVDVTASGPEDRALLKRYGLFGPPALLFFAPGGGELAEARVIGFQPPQRFLRTLDTLASRTAHAMPIAIR